MVSSCEANLATFREFSVKFPNSCGIQGESVSALLESNPQTAKHTALRPQIKMGKAALFTSVFMIGLLFAANLVSKFLFP